MTLKNDAIATLRGNDRGRHTVPAAGLYPHLWAWDSAFAAIGWGHIDLDRALAELETLLAGAWPDGRIPHIAFDTSADGYWPDPAFWGTDATRPTSSITQPPLWATAARRLVELGLDVERLKPLLGPIEASHLFFARARDPKGWNLVSVAHPWESGMDNSPAWDGPLSAVDPNSAPPFERKDTKHVTDVSQRPTDDHYKRYAALVKAIENDDFGHGPFVVYDPGMTALLARAERDLAWLQSQVGEKSEAETRARGLTDALVTHLWNPTEARFDFFDVAADTKIPSPVLAAHLPAMLELPEPIDAAVKAKLQSDFEAKYPIPTTAPGTPDFDRRRYWRGPSWVNLNWLLADVWGDSVRESTLEMVSKSGFREYFDPESGEGLGADAFTWTAALVLDFSSR